MPSNCTILLNSILLIVTVQLIYSPGNWLVNANPVVAPSSSLALNASVARNNNSAPGNASQSQNANATATNVNGTRTQLKPTDPMDVIKVVLANAMEWFWKPVPPQGGGSASSNGTDWVKPRKTSMNFNFNLGDLELELELDQQT